MRYPPISSKYIVTFLQLFGFKRKVSLSLLSAIGVPRGSLCRVFSEFRA